MRLIDFFSPAKPSTPLGGTYDIVGDVHGQADALLHLMSTAGWVIPTFDPASYQPIPAYHPDGRHMVFVGDLVNKGPDSLTVLRLLLGMLDRGSASAVKGNHEDALLKAMKHTGKRAAKHSGSASCRLRKQLKKAPDAFRLRVEQALANLPIRLALPMPAGLQLSGSGRLHVVHAGAHPGDLDPARRPSERRLVHGTGLKACGKKHWARTKALAAPGDWLVHGHFPSQSPEIVGRTIGIDTGAGAGRRLTLLRAESATFLAVDIALAPRHQPAPDRGSLSVLSA